MHLAIKASPDFTTYYRHKLFFCNVREQVQGKASGVCFPGAYTHSLCSGVVNVVKT